MPESADFTDRLDLFFHGLIAANREFEKSFKVSMQQFFRDLNYRKEIFDHYKEISDRMLSSDFNVFNYLRPDENTLSDILANILDYEGSHGQGELFQQRFLHFASSLGLFFPSNIGERFEVRREHYANGRIDILLESPSFAIIIENKPFAADQINQINRYYDAMEIKHPGKVSVIYLNRTKAGPQNFTDEGKREQVLLLQGVNRLLIIQYADILEFCLDIFQRCESIKFRFFLGDFMDYIRKSFPMGKGEPND